MRSERLREASATFLLGLLLASAVITAGQAGLPSGTLPFTPPGVWDSHKTLTVPFGRAQTTAETTRAVASPAAVGFDVSHIAVSDRGPSLGSASPREAGRTDPGATAGDRRSFKGRDVSRRDKPTGPQRPDRVTSGRRTDGRGVGSAGDKDKGSHAAKGAGRRTAHESPGRAVGQRAHKPVAVADHRDHPSVDHKRGATGRKDKAHPGKARWKRSHSRRGRSA